MKSIEVSETPSPWHAGEKRLQESVGVADRMEIFGRRIIRSFMPDQHREFFSQLPFVVARAVDRNGDPWATIFSGHPGFISSPSDTLLEIDSRQDRADPAAAALNPGAAIGLLGIELHTRRRNRMNGAVTAMNKTGLRIKVGHSFGNCPQYIQLREFEFIRDPATPADAVPERLTAIDEAARSMILKADTFFVASYVDLPEGRQADVSHRGGKSGFVRIAPDGVLTIPDYAGNLHFNTLGNILTNGRAGLIFADFDTGDVLQLTGRADVVTESPEIAAFQGAERLWTFTPTSIVRRKGALPLRWSFLEWSPNSLMTGSWEQAVTRLAAERKRAAWRPMRLAKIVDESAVIRSFHLEPADGDGLIAHVAGQHLPIRVAAGPNGEAVQRTYTISTAPSDDGYRISVKREGLVSTYLHDSLAVGAVIEAHAPQGAFTLDAQERRPVVLIAGGVGVTPMLSMLRHIVYEGLRIRRIRPTYFFQAARTFGERAFDREVDKLAAAAKGAVRVVRALKEPASPDAKGADHIGHVDMSLLKRILPFDDHDFYLCGPPAFMQAIYDGLRGLSVLDARIHAEAFGPASLTRKPDRDAPAIPLGIPASSPTPVAFAASGKEARWKPGAGSLLDFAEERGLAPAYSCRLGNCGSCRTKIIEGAVAYESAPSFRPDEGEALICCATPAAGKDGAVARLILDL
jgi:ferredoxin-NADP reductase/predicted pyridoxine 5'-phosphate oxidase superfamily flavin-nucleotide-binding protein